MGRNKLEAVIWDMDGVLADTNDFHFRTWSEIYRRFSDDRQPLARTQFESLFGMLNDETVIRLFGSDRTSAAFIQTVGLEKEVLFREMIRGRIDPLPGVRSWLSYFQDRGLDQAVASSAPELNIKAILSELNLFPYFTVVLSGEGPPQLASKPAPDIFQEAARHLKRGPAHCLVIEDSIVGVQAAKAAGMACLAVTTTHQASELIDADWTIGNFGDLQPVMMVEMWEQQSE
ncbi:MAG TPA: HAD family phosphatase [candidate division Zixibacteria bacterium]|nr:HAD family phosphatase [candidate division Zixibacteria bacterium]